MKTLKITARISEMILPRSRAKGQKNKQQQQQNTKRKRVKKIAIIDEYQVCHFGTRFIHNVQHMET